MFFVKAFEALEELKPLLTDPEDSKVSAVFVLTRVLCYSCFVCVENDFLVVGAEVHGVVGESTVDGCSVLSTE